MEKTPQEQFERLQANLCRARALQNKLMETHNGKRNVWDEAGYPEHVSYESYLLRYKRGDIAKTVVDILPEYSWSATPTIKENRPDESMGISKKDNSTLFEEKWAELVEKHSIYSYMCRADKLARIGNYSVLYFGLNDVTTTGQPATAPKKAETNEVLFITAYRQDKAPIQAYVSDIKSREYGKPQKYTLQPASISCLTSGSAESTTSLSVDAARILHFPSIISESEIFGDPALESVWNRFIDLDKVTAGAGEMFWRGGYPGLNFNMDPSANPTNQELEAMNEEVENYIMGLSRSLMMRGVKAETIQSSMVSPKEYKDIYIEMISIGSRIPQRILLGSAAGALSSADADNYQWFAYVEARRESFCSYILRRLIEKLQKIGVLPETPNGYSITWPSFFQKNPKIQAEIANLRTGALVAYYNATGLTSIYPFEVFLRVIMEMTDEEVAKVMEGMEDEAGKLDKLPEDPEESGIDNPDGKPKEGKASDGQEV